MLSKYTILNNNTKLEPKRGKMKKSETDVDPPWGGREWERKNLLEMIIFYYYWLQYQKTKLFTLLLFIWDPKAYNKLVTS